METLPEIEKPPSGSLLSVQDRDIQALIKESGDSSIRGRRNRVLLALAWSTGLSISNLLKLQLWQMTYFVHQVDTFGTSTRFWFSDRIIGHNFGFYFDRTFEAIVPIPKPLRPMTYRYLEIFEDGYDPEHYVFPVMRKNDRMMKTEPLTTRDAHKILVELRKPMSNAAKLDWHKIRQVAVARMLVLGMSIQEIQHQTGYTDPKSIKNIASTYGIDWTSDPSFQPSGIVGLDYEGSIVSRNKDWYPMHLFPNRPPRKSSS